MYSKLIFYQDLRLVKFFSVVRTTFMASYLLLFLKVIPPSC